MIIFVTQILKIIEIKNKIFYYSFTIMQLYTTIISNHNKENKTCKKRIQKMC